MLSSLGQLCQKARNLFRNYCDEITDFFHDYSPRLLLLNYVFKLLAFWNPVVLLSAIKNEMYHTKYWLCMDQTQDAL